MSHITQVDTPEGRRYKTPVGLLPSVTTILSATMTLEQQQRLQRWRQRQLKAGRVTSEATDRGTKIHELIALQLQGDKSVECPNELLEFWHPVRRVIAAVDVPLAIEKPVYHPALRYAGTLDLVANWQGQLTIFDWKTSYRVKQWKWMNDAALQVAAYKAAFEQIYQVQLEQAIVVVISPNRTQMFEVVVQQHWSEWLKRLEAYSAG